MCMYSLFYVLMYQVTKKNETTEFLHCCLTLTHSDSLKGHQVQPEILCHNSSQQVNRLHTTHTHMHTLSTVCAKIFKKKKDNN